MSRTKTSSVRLPKEMYEDIDGICNDIGCSRNDWIKDTLKEKLREEFNEYSQNLEDVEPKATIEEIPEIKEPETIIEEVPKPTVTEIAQPTVTFIDEPNQMDNSNNPPYQMTNFNGKLLPLEKRYNI